jgi:hypothetical protein
MPEGAAFAGGMRELTPDMAQAADALDFIAQAFGTVSDKADEAATSVSAFKEEGEKAASLAEKFGIGADQFDTDVANAMASALKNVEADAELAAAAMEQYELSVGLATGSSIVFEGQMDVLAEALATGRLPVEDYVNEVARLSGLDLSKIDMITDAMIAQGDVAGAQGFANLVSGEGGLEQFSSAFDKTGSLLEQLGLIGGAEEETDTGGIAGILGLDTLETDLSSAEDIVTSLTITALSEAELMDNGYSAAWDSISTSAKTAATDTETAFGTASAAVIEDIQEVDRTLDDMLTKQRQVEFTLTATSTVDAPISSGNGSHTPVPTFQEGGFTGTGTKPFMAMLHPNEMVIPLNKLPVGGGQNEDGGNFEIALSIDGRQVESSVTNIKRLKNER